MKEIKKAKRRKKMKRLETIEAKLKKHIEVLKRAQKELERIVKEKENEKL